MGLAAMIAWLRDLNHACARARAHELHVERSLGGDRISIDCPNCRTGQQVILRMELGKVTGVCNRCDLTTLDLNELLLAPAERSEAAMLSRPAEPLRLYSPAELAAMPEPEWLVEPLIPDGGFVCLFGDSGTYKTFLAIDIAAQAPGIAVYISAEGSPRRFGDRVTAWEEAAGRSSGIVVHPYSVDLTGDDYDQLCNALQSLDEPPRLIVVDTLARNMGDGDENATKDMNALVTACDKLRATFGCAVLLIHHVGHGDKTRERGNRSLRGALDMSILVTSTQQARTVRIECKKIRDGEAFEPRIVRLVPIGGSLVAAETTTPAAVVEDEVRAYLEANPDASQRQVEKDIDAPREAIREAVKRVRRSETAHPAHRRTAEQSAPPKGAPIYGAPRRAAPNLIDQLAEEFDADVTDGAS
jgi:hypothetical protein